MATGESRATRGSSLTGRLMVLERIPGYTEIVPDGTIDNLVPGYQLLNETTTQFNDLDFYDAENTYAYDQESPVPSGTAYW